MFTIFGKIICQDDEDFGRKVEEMRGDDVGTKRQGVCRWWSLGEGFVRVGLLSTIIVVSTSCIPCYYGLFYSGSLWKHWCEWTLPFDDSS